ncbi:hypothetical protein O9G_004414 [Rozella allomycis CSF55]|uniref:Uncharacterized protein n=1 Tax=Rozella allomycis (strain CSF55) TaxID=988480 RepID=A0A075AS42_ROZAC|nr:hypothetical protein O9G_004414 [Rozella allomycis CSF55]|eukprot:EPZ33000.1 hypothetical protein O9G_004414 [Rozella allomycis CSF55]
MERNQPLYCNTVGNAFKFYERDFERDVGFLKKNPNHEQISSMKEFQKFNNETISCLNCQVFAGTGEDEDNPFEKGTTMNSMNVLKSFSMKNEKSFKLKMGKMYKSLGFRKEDFKRINVTNTSEGLQLSVMGLVAERGW